MTHTEKIFSLENHTSSIQGGNYSCINGLERVNKKVKDIGVIGDYYKVDVTD
ncbi:MAG: hypothetical protein J7L15_00495 [Clostridiales bacterium]|nr:hypothetical protein [Clostridiales bacterium]